MENKKTFIDNQGARNNESPGVDMGPLMKRQSNTVPQHYRLMQYGVKPTGTGYSNFHQHPQLLQQPGTWAPMPLHQQQQTSQLQTPSMHSHQRPNLNAAPTIVNAEHQKLAVKPFEPVDNKKKFSPNQQQLRSPSAKRPSHGTVTMQGWLHKQGSEGLKVWRKRWFVLSDYCLYYYKGPEEEKILGSILLPSYKVSLCGAEDKVYRKFAFKCEHANMRTYYLAADSQQVMMNWIRALNLACMLQSNVDSDRQSGPSVSSMYNASLDNSDSGFHQQYNACAHAHNVPVHMHSCSNTSGASVSENTVSVSTPSYTLEFGGGAGGGGAGGVAGGGAVTSGGIQPVYANAPPKPRRLTDGGYSSSSPEFAAIDRYQHQHQHIHGPFYPYGVQYAVERTCSKSPINNMYLRNCDNRAASMNAPVPASVPVPTSASVPYGTTTAKVHYNHVYDQQLQTTPQRDCNVERRTPDTYGRSKLNSNKMKDTSDYEDVYADEVIYKRPLSPVAYSNIKKVSPVASITVQHRPYTPVYISGPPASDPSLAPGYKLRLPPAHQSERIQNTIPRPHSADFLEYEVKHRNIGKLNVSHCQQPRPKSSLDINRSPSDTYYYSKESYAESMRKSAQYLQQLPAHYHNKPNEHLIMVNGQNMYQRPKHMHEVPPNMRNMHMHMNDKQQLTNGSEGSLDIDMFSVPYAKSPVCHITDELEYNNELKDMQRERDSPTVREYHGDQFKRSASARLLRTPVQSTHEDYYGSVSRDGEQKREESMKRLLEWKQRMLQSPLNRKMSSGLAMPRAVVGRSDMYLRSTAHPHHPHGYPQSPCEVRDTREHRRSLVGPPVPQYSSYSSDDEASGSICMTAHETFPRAMSKKMWSSNTLTPSRSQTLNRPQHEFDQSRLSPYPYAQSPLPGPGSGSAPALHREMGQHHANIQKSKLNNMDATKRLENLQKLEKIKQHLLELEKQYEKGKPLVNLVDNMVKLGSLYRNPNDQHYNSNVRDRLEFNQQIQEQRLLAEERRDWNRLSPNHMQLQTKVQQLYQLDRLLQEESGTLQCLQHDKEKIERALGGLRHRLNKGHKDPTEIEHARKQQIRLENELSRVHYMLAQNSKKLEETVAGNARLEQELLVLRQKLQLSRQHRSSAQFSNAGAGDSLPCAAGTSAILEAELHRVQQLVGDLQRQRQELSSQVRQLTDRSHSLSQQIRPSCTTPVNLANNASNNKKRVNTSWRETDLDTMYSIDHGIDWDPQNKSRPTTPLYVNTDPTKPTHDNYNRSDELNYPCMEDNQQQNTECIPQEKPEIKTVRIVKRESERRQRDREKTSSNTMSSDSSSSQQKWDTVVEEDDQGLNHFYMPSSHNEPIMNNVYAESPIANHLTMMDKSNNILNRQGSISSPSLYSQIDSYNSDIQSNSTDGLSLDKSPVLSPVFKSEAARQIIIEMSGVSSEPSTLKNSARRTVPKEKRRHYTAPHNNLIMKSLSNFPTDNKSCMDSRRARDDLDMERALRQRTDTPDVVRSTMSSKELKYNENTIDNILGTPNKISIPERYIPEQLPQLSVEEQRHRLRKVESIKKMLSDSTILSSASSTAPPGNTESEGDGDKTSSSSSAKATSKIVEEKRQREHLLQLNQILAKQVMEMSKIVAVKALATLPLEPQKVSLDDDDLSPVTPLPLYQQRDNYYS